MCAVLEAAVSPSAMSPPITFQLVFADRTLSHTVSSTWCYVAGRYLRVGLKFNWQLKLTWNS